MTNSCEHITVKYTNTSDWERVLICTHCDEDFTEVTATSQVNLELTLKILRACITEHDTMGCYTCDDIGVPCAMRPVIDLMKVIS